MPSSVHRTRIHNEKAVGDGRVVHAVGHPRRRPGGRRRGVCRAVRPVGVHGRGRGRARVAHRHAGGQHDGRGHAREVREQQSRGRAPGQKAVPGAGLQRARRFMSGARRETSPAAASAPPRTTARPPAAATTKKHL